MNYGIRISEINGGSLRNAIPRESTACVVVESEEFLTDLDALITQIKSEYQVTEPDMIVEVVKEGFTNCCFILRRFKRNNFFDFKCF